MRFFLHHVGQSHFADEVKVDGNSNRSAQVQAFLALFLAAHGEEIAASEASPGRWLKGLWQELQALCSELATAQASALAGLDLMSFEAF